MGRKNSSDLGVTNEADGVSISGGTTQRVLKWTGANITLSGSGTNVFTFPSSGSTLSSLELPETLLNKTLTTPTIVDYTNASHNHTTLSGGGKFRALVKTANNLTGSSLSPSSLINITDLSVSIDANEVWQFEAHLSVKSSGGTAGMTFAVDLVTTAGASSEWNYMGTGSAFNTSTRCDRVGGLYTVSTANITGAICTAASLDGSVHITGVIINGNTNSNNFTIRVGKVTSNGFVIYAGSYLLMNKIS